MLIKRIAPIAASTAAILILLMSPEAVRPQVPVHDFQIWNETTIIKPLVKTKDDKGKDVTRLSALFFGTLRLGQNRLFPVDRRIGAGFDLRLNGNFSVAPTYLYRSGEPGRGRKEYEHRIRFDVTYQKKWKTFGIKNRDRIEYRVRHSRSDSVRFRNKFTLSIPVKKDDKEIFTPFVATEPFYDFSAKQWSRNEFSAGISRKLSSIVSSEFFYIRQDNRGATQKSINGIGANIKITLN